MDYEDAIDVLRSWTGREVLVVAYVEPGVSLRPMTGVLSTEDMGRGVVRAAIAADGRDPVRIALPRATFHEASWVPGREQSGLSVVQGATRVDVFCEG